jgi:hypothetical protein
MFSRVAILIYPRIIGKRRAELFRLGLPGMHNRIFALLVFVCPGRVKNFEKESEEEGEDA